MKQLFAIRVSSYQEDKILFLMEERVHKDTYTHLYLPKKVRNKKYLGRWRDVEEVLFPGYIFVESESILDFVGELHKVQDFALVIGSKTKTSKSYLPLSEKEQKRIKAFYDFEKNIPTSVSEVKIRNGKIYKVISGPLKDVSEEEIVKVDLHHRYVTVRSTLGEEEVDVRLTIKIVESEGDLDSLKYLFGEEESE